MIICGIDKGHFYTQQQELIWHVLAIAILSVGSSVRLFVTRVDQSKTVQSRITIFSLLAVGKTLVLGSVKLFHKFERGHPEQGC